MLGDCRDLNHHGLATASLPCIDDTFGPNPTDGDPRVHCGIFALRADSSPNPGTIKMRRRCNENVHYSSENDWNILNKMRDRKIRANNEKLTWENR